MAEGVAVEGAALDLPRVLLAFCHAPNIGMVSLPANAVEERDQFPTEAKDTQMFV
jgi:hypothetical protein